MKNEGNIGLVVAGGKGWSVKLGKGNGKNPKLNGRDPTNHRKTQTPVSKQTQTQSSTPQGLIQQEMHTLT